MSNKKKKIFGLRLSQLESVSHRRETIGRNFTNYSLSFSPVAPVLQPEFRPRGANIHIYICLLRFPRMGSMLLEIFPVSPGFESFACE